MSRDPSGPAAGGREPQSVRAGAGAAMSRDPDGPQRTPEERRLGEQVDEEIRFHLEMRARALERRGMPRRQARQEARRRFGDVEQTKEVCVRSDRRWERRMGRRRWWNGLAQDAALAWRRVRRGRRFVATTGLVLALGIGAATTLFGVIDAVLLRPLPYPDSERLYLLFETEPQPSAENFAWANFEDLREAAVSFEGLSAWTWRAGTLTGRGSPQRVEGRAVSPGFFELIGVPPLLGRGFRTEEGQEGQERVVVLGHALCGTRSAAPRTWSAEP